MTHHVLCMGLSEAKFDGIPALPVLVLRPMSGNDGPHKASWTYNEILQNLRNIEQHNL